MQNVVKIYSAIILWLLMGASLIAVTPGASAQGADGSAVLRWSVPTERENGEPLAVDDIGGYEIRYRAGDAEEFSSVIVPDGSATSFTLNDLTGANYAIEVAAFDTDGLFSDFVPINYRAPSKPLGPSGVAVQPTVVDVLVACLAYPNCRVATEGEF